MTPKGLVIRFDEYGAAYSEAPSGEWTRRPEFDDMAHEAINNRIELEDSHVDSK